MVRDSDTNRTPQRTTAGHRRWTTLALALTSTLACHPPPTAEAAPPRQSAPSGDSDDPPVVMEAELAAATSTVLPKTKSTPRLSIPLLQSVEDEYRTPGADIEALLTAAPPPAPLFHGGSRTLALAHRQSSVPVERLARPSLGLAGYVIDPTNRTLHGKPLITKLDVQRLDSRERFLLLPPDGALLEYPEFSPDGRHITAAAVWPDSVRLVVYDLLEREDRVLPQLLNAALGSPCEWMNLRQLACRVVPAGAETLELPRVLGPNVTEHIAGHAQARTYSNLLQNSADDVLFEHYFSSDLVLVSTDGETSATPVSGILPLAKVSPDGRWLLTTELVRPYSRIVGAQRFPRLVRVWDLEQQSLAHEFDLPDGGAWPPRGNPAGPRQFAWNPSDPATLTWIEAHEKPRRELLVKLPAPFDGAPTTLLESTSSIAKFGWTSRDTLYVTRSHAATPSSETLSLHTEQHWVDLPSGDNALTVPLRTNGEQGRIVELDRPGDSRGVPFTARADAQRTGRVEVRSTDGNTELLPVHLPRDKRQRVIAVLGPTGKELLVSRETLHTPPNYLLLAHGQSRKLTDFVSWYPELRGVQRRPIHYQRADGVRLSAMLYLPPEYRPGEPRPTVFWIYPSEHDDASTVVHTRSHEFWSVAGPSRFALLLRGYVLVDHPSMPIIGPSSARNDSYLTQLTESAEAVVAHVVDAKIADAERLAVAGRSYGAFSAANLLLHTKLFRTAIAVSGAYNRTLTPFGFQHEQRSFWQAADLYARISPFFHAHRFTRPILLVHGEDDENAGTPATQSARFFQALAGHGASVRHVQMPFEGHQMRGHESNLHVVTEYIAWLDRQLAPPSAPFSSPPLERPTASPERPDTTKKSTEYR